MDQKIREHLGDLKLIDFMYANKERNEARLVLVTVGYIDDSKEMQTALFDKMEGYLSHIQSEEFKRDYPQPNVVIEVDFNETPSQITFVNLYASYGWCESWGVKLCVYVEEKPLTITKDENGNYHVHFD